MGIFPRTPTPKELAREYRASRVDGRGAVTILAGVAVVIGGVALMLVNGILGFVVLFAGIVVIAMPFAAAERRFVKAWAAHRGLAPDSDSAITVNDLFPPAAAGLLPVLEHSGCSWSTSADTVGALNGIPARIGRLFVSRGAGKSKETLFDGGYVAMTLPKKVGKRYPGLSVRVRRVRNTDDNHIDRFDNLEEVHLESLELDAMIDIFAARNADPVAVRELFNPQLIVHLLKHPTSWDQSGRCLLVLDAEQAARNSEERDLLCYRAAHIYYAYSLESR